MDFRQILVTDGQRLNGSDGSALFGRNRLRALRRRHRLALGGRRRRRCRSVAPTFAQFLKVFEVNGIGVQKVVLIVGALLVQRERRIGAKDRLEVSRHLQPIVVLIDGCRRSCRRRCRLRRQVSQIIGVEDIRVEPHATEGAEYRSNCYLNSFRNKNKIKNK